METLICWWGQRSYIKVKGHLRSSCKIGWKCENGLIFKVEVQFESNLVYWYNIWTFICSCSQRSCTKIIGHLRSSCKIGWKCENGLIWKVEVWWFELYLVYWYNMETFICSCSQRSQSKVKGHLMLTYIIHKMRRQATLAVRGTLSIFCCNATLQWCCNHFAGWCSVEVQCN